ncbi:MAG: hypothetical protein VX309_07615, partial [Pseudomonadota bacterium]|nr:hypothetical protein [Pseudomonadota bacterium]
DALRPQAAKIHCAAPPQAHFPLLCIAQSSIGRQDRHLLAGRQNHKTPGQQGIRIALSRL